MHYMSDDHNYGKGGSPLFSLENVSFRYPDTTVALHEVSLNIYPGDRIALVGRNGSGKTTLVKLLSGLLGCSEGTVWYKERPLDEAALGELRLKAGVLFQDPDDHLFCNSLDEDVAFGPMNQGLDETTVNSRVVEQLAVVGLESLRYKPAHLLSYGQKKRAAFAAIMAMNPEILILDEPTANLDPRQERVFKELLRQYTGTLIIIDHDLLFLYDLCERAVVMSCGTIHHDYSFDRLVSQRDSLREHGLDFTFRFSCCGSHQTVHVHHHHHQTHEHHSGAIHVPTPETQPPLMELQHYFFRYTDGTPGLCDVNLIIRTGDTLALVGENGAGKSTLAGCLLGLNQGKGYFFYNGRPVTPAVRKTLWRQIGMVFQNSADQLFSPSCREEVAFGPRQMGIKGEPLRLRVEEALGRVHLGEYIDKVPLNMSGGERKRLAIAAALSMHPEMLILDEPTAGLDPHGEELLIEILENLGLTTIIITHDLYFIERLSTRAIVMHQGALIRDYRTTDFLTDDHLQSVNGLDYSYKSDCGRRIMALQNHSHNVEE
ncbi:MAG: energy-coupling factor transporter ATPase [Desulfopila sp.]|jgi:energy-coupling factor transporter ATP-binding protein EcfA2|nr:energy-coupling factor transporter ATPase [Desulfopila sp.]